MPGDPGGGDGDRRDVVGGGQPVDDRVELRILRRAEEHAGEEAGLERRPGLHGDPVDPAVVQDAAAVEDDRLVRPGHVGGDALRDDREPGTVIMVENEHVPKAFMARTTPHQLGICDVLAAATLTDIMPKHLTLYGVEPKQLDVGIGLSPEVEAGMEKIISAVVEQLRHSGYEVKHHGIESEH